MSAIPLPTSRCDVGVVGLTPAAQCLARLLDNSGYRVAVFNRPHENIDTFLNSEAMGVAVVATQSLEVLCAVLTAPRLLLLMDICDNELAQLLPYLTPGDIVIDHNQSSMPDTAEWVLKLASLQKPFIADDSASVKEKDIVPC